MLLGVSAAQPDWPQLCSFYGVVVVLNEEVAVDGLVVLRGKCGVKIFWHTR